MDTQVRGVRALRALKMWRRRHVLGRQNQQESVESEAVVGETLKVVEVLGSEELKAALLKAEALKEDLLTAGVLKGSGVLRVLEAFEVLF